MDELPCEDLYGSPHRLSLCGSVILFYCKRTTNVGGRSESTPMCCRLSFNREHNGFRRVIDGAVAITGKTSSHLSIVKCQRALHVQRRVTTPCVLVMKKSEKGESFRYSLLTLGSSNQLEPCFEFKLPYQIGESVSILRGPTVLWRHAGDDFYTSLQAGEVRQTPIQLSHSVVGELPLDRGEVFVLGPQNPSGPGPSSRSAIQALGYLVDNGRVFDGTILLPHPYICITRCILVLSAQQADGAAAGSLRSAVAAATSHQQLVYFENGLLQGVCQLPFEQPENIQVVNAGRHGCLFVVSFHRGHACAVWKETFQVASCWSDVGSVHVDDFLGCGSDQMLLLFKDQGSTGQPLDRFLLTDLCGISYARCQDNDAPKGSPPPPENYLLTLQALESRLQSGLSVLQELQREARVKDRVLRQAVRALTDVVSGGEPALPQPEQEGLVALWDDDDDESKRDAADDEARNMPAVSPQPQVEKLWRRFAEDQMVVGVILSAESSVPVAAVSLSILTETGQSSTPAVTQTRCQVSWLPAPCPSSSSSASAFPEPAAKRSRRRDSDVDTRRLAVTAAARLTPLLNSGRVKCCVVLHYVPRQVASVSSPAPVSLHCGQFALDIHSDFKTRLLRNPDLKTDEATEDLLSLMAVLDPWVFHVASPDHSLGDVHGWIQKRLGCKRVEVSPQHLLSESSGAAALMLLHWHQITPFQGELTVHSSELQTLQFLDLLLAHLPVSCTVHPVRVRGGEGAARVLSLALEREVVSLRECASSLLCGGEEGEEEEEEKRGGGGQEEGTPEPASVKELQQWRELWQWDEDRTRRRLSPLVEVGRYRRLTQSLSQVQLEVDLAALLDTQRTLLS